MARRTLVTFLARSLLCCGGRLLHPLTQRLTAALLGAMVAFSGAAAVASSASAREVHMKTCGQTWKKYPSRVMELFASQDISYWELRQLMRDPCAARR